MPQKNCWNNSWFADPLLLGHYPADGLKLYQSDLPSLPEEDLATIHQPLDFYGVNTYHGQTVRATANGGYAHVSLSDGVALTTMDWPVTPEALYWGPRFFSDRYQIPIVITENGMANCDWIHGDGQVHDPQRIDFVMRYLQAYQRAIEDGVQGKGYFLWSIMDNFEWAYGYKQRFGLIYIDYLTQRRILKDSAHWYRAVIASNGVQLNSKSEALF